MVSNIVEQTTLFFRFGAALAIGILIGLEREHAYGSPESEADLFAGVRTFALLGLAGCTGALVADVLGTPWAFIAILLLLGALITVAYFVVAWRHDVGLTTEVSALITILAGALAYWEYFALAAALAVATTVLLALKLELETLIQRMSREDVLAILRFAVITAIVLPILPNRAFGPPPFDVLNPYTIWLIVVLISGISFLGYFLMKIVEPRQGIGLIGLLGGLASSTAVTLSFAQRSREETSISRAFALGIIVAWTMMFLRVLVEVGVLNGALLRLVWLPLTAAAAAGLLFCVYLYRTHPAGGEGDIMLTNPFELRPAIQFGLLYALVLLVSRSAQLYVGETGVYVSSIVAGFADVDAITLSMAQLSRPESGLDLETAARAVVLAVMSNTAVKGGMVLVLGSRALRRALLPGLILVLAVGIAAAFFL